MSVLLDTRVVSEPIRKAPDPAVEKMDHHPVLGSPIFSTIREAELFFGAAILSPGCRRNMLLSNIEKMLRESFEGCMLPFNCEAAQAFAEIAAARRFAEYSDATAACQIAAIARSRGAAAAIRNVRDFKETGVEVINPWNEG